MTLQCFIDDPGLRQRLWEEFAKEAGVTVPQLKKAYNRVVADGYYGPLPGGDFIAARDLLRKALQHTPSVTFTAECAYTCNGAHECKHPDHEEFEEPGPLAHDEEYEVEPEIIKKEMFFGILEIYGHLNL